MDAGGFFSEQMGQSRVKSKILTDYFAAWARIMAGHAGKHGSGSHDHIAYVDLFAGRGRYDDGNPSTPLILLRSVIDEPKLRTSVATLFNDVDSCAVEALRCNIEGIPGLDTLAYPPVVLNQEVGPALSRALSATRLVPTLFFIDPWGYKGVSLDLIAAAMKDWGSECVLFFCFNRVRAAVVNDKVGSHMAALFGPARLARLRAEMQELDEPEAKEQLVIEQMCDALRERAGEFVLPFRFRDERGTRTMHHVIHVSKHPRGHAIMKDVMAKASSDVVDGVASFEYNPADLRAPRLFAPVSPLTALENALLSRWAGRSLTVEQIFANDRAGTAYTLRNYKSALRNLEQQAAITCDPPAHRRRANTMGDRVLITFPPLKEPRDGDE